MQNTYIIFIIAIILGVGIFTYFIYINHSKNNQTITVTTKNNSTISNNNQTSNTTTKTYNRIKLSNSQYYSISYKIFPGPLSSATLRALTGIEMSNTTVSNGTEIRISMNNNLISNVSVPKNDSLYFIEASYGDDFSNYEGSLGDDGIILVNNSGYIIQ